MVCGAELGPWDAEVAELATEVGDTDNLDASFGPQACGYSSALAGCREDAVEA